MHIILVHNAYKLKVVISINIDLGSHLRPSSLALDHYILYFIIYQLYTLILGDIMVMDVLGPPPSDRKNEFEHSTNLHCRQIVMTCLTQWMCMIAS